MKFTDHTKALIVSTILVLVWVSSFYPSLVSMTAIWQRSDTFAHGYLVYPIVLWLIWRRRFAISSLDLKPNYLPLLFLAGLTFTWLAAEVAGVLVAAQFAAVFWLPCAFWCLFGHKLIKCLWFPICYLIFAVPIGEELIPQLQEITADITVFLLAITGIPVFRDGLYISVPGGLFEVAVACSGIRYLIASIALGTLYAHLQFASLRRQFAFILISALVPIFANGIRAYIIVLLAYSSDMKLATGVDHLIYGWVFFGIVMFILFWVGSFWHQPQADPIASATRRGAWLRPTKVLVVACIMGATLLLGLGYAKKVKEQVLPPLVLNSEALMRNFLPEELSKWEPEFKGADDYFTGFGHFSGQKVVVYIALYSDNKQGKELVNFDHLFYNDTWTPLDHSVQGSQGKIHLTSINGLNLELSYWYQLSSFSSAQASKIKLAQAWSTLLSNPSTGAIIILATDKSENSAKALSEASSEILSIPSLWLVGA